MLVKSVRIKHIYSENLAMKEWGERMVTGGGLGFVFIFILNLMYMCLYLDNV